MTQQADGLVAFMERHQVAGYVGAIAAGAMAGWAAPGLGSTLDQLINPVPTALLYVTFLQVPAAELVRSLRAGRFLGAALAVNFVAVPLVVAAMFGFLPDDQAVRLGALLVLLTPCVDYVITFSGPAGGDGRRLLAATPLLLLTQMVMPPVPLVAFMGAEPAQVVEPGPFVEAFLVLIVIPLALAWLTQAWAVRRPAGRAVAGAAGTAMVPPMVATLMSVVASQPPKLDGNLAAVAGVVPFYVLFLVVMAVTGIGVARLFRLDAAASRAIAFTGAAAALTRSEPANYREHVH